MKIARMEFENKLCPAIGGREIRETPKIKSKYPRFNAALAALVQKLKDDKRRP